MILLLVSTNNILDDTLLHRNINVQAEHFFRILVVHSALNVVSTARRLIVEDSLLNDRDLTFGRRAGETVDVDLTRTERNRNGGIFAEITLLGKNLQTTIVTFKLPGTSSNFLVEETITNDSGVLSRDDRVVNDFNRVHLSVSRFTRADFPSDGTRGSQNSLIIRDPKRITYSKNEESENELHDKIKFDATGIRVKGEMGKTNRMGGFRVSLYFSMDELEK